MKLMTHIAGALLLGFGLAAAAAPAPSPKKFALDADVQRTMRAFDVESTMAESARSTCMRNSASNASTFCAWYDASAVSAVSNARPTSAFIYESSRLACFTLAIPRSSCCCIWASALACRALLRTPT